MNKKTIGIIGLGLIGGSLAWALKTSTEHLVCGCDINSETLQQALKAGAIDVAVSNAANCAEMADVLILCLPVCAIPNTIQQIIPVLKPGTIISDVGSTKSYLSELVPNMLPVGVSYVGGHPMAGAERDGFMAADPNLFVGRPYVLVQSGQQDRLALQIMKELAVELGAVPVVIDADRHDAAVSKISHLPHIVAAAMVMLAAEDKERELNFSLAAAGFNDVTRIAAANPQMWVDVCLSNRANIINNLIELQHNLQNFLDKLQNKDQEALLRYFSNARMIRNSLSPAQNTGGELLADKAML